MKPIDPIAIKQAIKDGYLIVLESKNNIYIKDVQTGECVCIYRRAKNE